MLIKNLYTEQLAFDKIKMYIIDTKWDLKTLVYCEFCNVNQVLSEKSHAYRKHVFSLGSAQSMTAGFILPNSGPQNSLGKRTSPAVS